MSGYGLRVTNMESHTFMFTNVSTAIRKDLVTKIKSLGGSCIDNISFDKSITHLVCSSLKKTEKFFGACISGKWIISPQFIIDSHTVGMWLDEENYLFRIGNTDPLNDRLAMTARRWRNQVNHYGIVAFRDWRVSILMTAEKAVVFKRLLRYGGAEILHLSIPFSKCTKIKYITYVFVDTSHENYAPDLQALGLVCLREKFLGDYIMEDPPPDPFDYIVTKESDNISLLDCSVEPKGKSSKRHKESVASQSSAKVNSSNTGRNTFTGANPLTSQSSSSAVASTKQKPSQDLQITNVVVNPSYPVHSSNHSLKTPDEFSSFSSQFEKVNDVGNVLQKRVAELSKVNSVDILEVKKPKVANLQTESSNAMLTDKNHQFSRCEKSLDSNSNFSDQPGPAVKAISQPMKQIVEVSDIDTQENVGMTRPAWTNKKSHFALEYLDPNVPSVHVISCDKNFINQKDQNPSTASSHFLPTKTKKDVNTVTEHSISSNQNNHKESKPFTAPSHSSPVKPNKGTTTPLKRLVSLHHQNLANHRDSKPSSHFSPQMKPERNVSTLNSAQKRKPDTFEDNKKSSLQKRMKSISDYHDFHRQGETNHRPNEMSAKNIAHGSCDDSLLNPNSDVFEFEKRSEQDSNQEKMKQCATHSSHISDYVESSHESYNCHDYNSSSLLLCPAEVSSPKVNGEETKLNQVNVENGGHNSSLVNLPQNSILKTPVKINQSGPSSSNIEKSPSASLKLSPNVYLYGLPPGNSSNPDHRSESQITPAGKKSTPASEKKSTPASNKSRLKSCASREKGKPSQSVLQQFGFRSTSIYKDAQHMDVLVPKAEPVSPCPIHKALPKRNHRSQLVLYPDGEDEIIIISDDDDDEFPKSESGIAFSKTSIATKKSDAVVLSSSEEDGKIEGSNCGYITSKQPILCSSQEELEMKQKEADCERKASELNPQDNHFSVGNIFENISDFISKSTEESHELLQGGENSSQNIRIGEDSDFLVDGETSPGMEKDRSVASVKRQLFQKQESTSGICDKIKNRNVLKKEDSVEMKQLIIPLARCDDITDFDQAEDGNVSTNNLPHIAWSSSFYSNQVTSSTAEKRYVPSIISQCMESSRENGFYNIAMDHGKPTLARLPTVDLLSQFIHLLTCDDFTVKNQAFSDLMCWTQNHPPTDSSMTKVYSDLFELSADQTVLYNLLEGLNNIQDSEKYFHLLEFTVAVFEINFSSCLQSTNKKTLKECLLIKWVWSHSQAIHHNRKTKEFLRTFEAVLSSPQSTSTAIHSMSVLISMIGECLRLSSVKWDTQNRKFLSDTITLFAMDTAKIIRDSCSDQEPFYILSHLLSFKPPWFRAMVTASMLSFSNDYLLNQKIQVRDISLHAIVSQYFFLLPPLSSKQKSNVGQEASVLTLSSQCHDDDGSLQINGKNRNVDELDMMKSKNLTAARVNKVNGKGESALHIAAMKGDVVTMKKLLSIPGVDVNLKDNNGWTPLHEACNHGKYTCVELLLKYIPPNTLGAFFLKQDGVSSKVDIDAPGDLDITPLHDAVMHNHVDISKLLLRYGGNGLLASKTCIGYTALDLATTEEMYQVLLAGSTDHCPHSLNSLNLSQDSQSEDSLNLSQSEFISCFPPDHMYEQVLNVCDTGDVLSASYSDCSVFVSLIALLLNSFLEASSVTMQSEDSGGTVKVSLLSSHETSVLRRMRLHVKLLKKHLKKIMPDAFSCLEAQLLTLSAAISGHMG